MLKSRIRDIEERARNKQVGCNTGSTIITENQHVSCRVLKHRLRQKANPFYIFSSHLHSDAEVYATGSLVHAHNKNF